MATLFSPELNTVGASAMSGGVASPQPIDYSGLFKAVSDLKQDPVKVTEFDLKASQRQELNVELNKLAQIENSTKKAAAFRISRKEASGKYTYLSQEELASAYSTFTGELPLDIEDAKTIEKANIEKSFKEDPRMQLVLPQIMAESKGDPDKLMSLARKNFLQFKTIDEEVKLDKARRESEGLKLGDQKKAFFVQVGKNYAGIAQGILDSAPTLVKQLGIENLSKEEQNSRLSSFAKEQENQARISFRNDAAKAGFVATKEEEDQAVSVFTDAATFLDTVANETSVSLTLTQKTDSLKYLQNFSPALREYIRTPGGSEWFAGIMKADLVQEATVLAQKKIGLGAPSVNTEGSGGIDYSVQGNPDSPTYVSQKYKFFPETAIRSGMSTSREDKKFVVDSNYKLTNNPEGVRQLPVATTDSLQKNFMYQYLFTLPEVDVSNDFTSKAMVEKLYGTKPLAFIKVLADKNPANAPDMYNKVNLSSRLSAQQVLAKMNANLDTINMGWEGTKSLNPFVFKLDSSGKIVGSIQTDVIPKNQYIRTALINNDALGQTEMTQETFWKVVRSYTATADLSNYNDLKSNVDSLQILVNFTSQIPGSDKTENAKSYVQSMFDQKMTGVTPAFEGMTPSELEGIRKSTKPKTKADIAKGIR